MQSIGNSSGSFPLSSIFPSRANTHISHNQNEEKESASSGNSKFHSTLESIANPDNNIINVDEFRLDLKNTTSYVESRLNEILLNMGIDPDLEFEFTTGYDGSIIINGDDPSIESIEAAVNSDFELSNLIRKMSSVSSSLKALENYLEFAAAYKNDPVAAVAKYGWMLDDNSSYDVTFSFENGKITSEVKFT